MALTKIKHSVPGDSAVVGASKLDAAFDAIDANTANVTTNTANILTNTANILTNTAGVATNTAAIATFNGLLVPTIQTYAQLIVNNPAASFPGYSGYCSDLKMLAVSDGVSWSFPLTEGRMKLATAAVSGAAADRFSLAITGQEPSVWYANGVYNMTYTNGAAQIAYTFCSTDPTVASNWTTPILVLGGGVGGQAGTCAHSYVYIEGTTIYIYYIEISSKNVMVATAPLVFTPAVGPVFSANAIVFTGVPGGGGTNGNCCVVKGGSTYYLFQESLWNNTFPIEGSTNSWQVACLTCSTPTGTFTLVGQQTSARPSPNGTCSGADIKIEGSTAVMFYHAGTYSRLFPTDIYRATMPVASLGTDAWVNTQLPLVPETFTVPPSGTGPGTLLVAFPAASGVYPTTLSTGQVISMTYTANSTAVTWSTTVTGTPTTIAQVNGLYLVNSALMKRTHFNEFDQIADPYVCTGPNKVSYLFYEGCNNRIPAFSIMVTPLLPIRSQADGPYSHLLLESRFPQVPYWDADNNWAYQNYPPPMVAGQANVAVSAAKTSGTWAIVATSGAPGGSIRTNTSAASGNFIEYDITAPPGTYALTLNYQSGPANGIFSITLYDGSQLAASAKTVDSYSASTAYASSVIANLWVLGYEMFRWRLRFACTSKNGTSTGFQIADCGFTVQRTGN